MRLIMGTNDASLSPGKGRTACQQEVQRGSQRVDVGGLGRALPSMTLGGAAARLAVITPLRVS